MKRWIVFILALAALLLPARTTAAAAEQDSYAVAVGDVWFYASADEDEKLFLLPQTYYAVSYTHLTLPTT